ncbi:hypothetical protein SARC_09277, partial [Sphaeroforma arctica JP610]
QLPHFHKNGFEVVAVWARTEVAAERVRQEHNIPFVSTDLDEVLMLKNVELVCVATPPFMSLEVCIKTIQTGKHVICEKPMATSAASARRMLSAAQYYPQLVSIVDHELRFVKVIAAMKAKMEEEYVGRILTIEANVCMASLVGGEYNWWCDQSLGGGALGALGSHMIDVLYYITGLKAVAVQGVLKTFVHHTSRINGYRHITADDYCNFQLKFPNDAHATILLNTHMPGKFVQDITIVGSKGRLLLRGQELWGYQKGMKKEELLHQERDKSVSLFVKGTDSMIRHLRRAFEKNLQELMHIFPTVLIATFNRIHRLNNERLNNERPNNERLNDERLNNQRLNTERPNNHHLNNERHQPLQPNAATFEDGLYTQKVSPTVDISYYDHSLNDFEVP